MASFKIGFITVAVVISISGCSTSPSKIGSRTSYAAPLEAGWIRDGQSLEFEKEPWYPTDNVENILDSEVYKVGLYRNLDILVESTDIRPYDKLYTKFGKNKYRLFEKHDAHH